MTWPSPIMKLGAFAGGYQELQRTVELDPQNVQAKLDLGALLLAAHQYPKSKDQANAVLAQQPNNADAFALLSSIALAHGRSRRSARADSEGACHRSQPLQLPHGSGADPERRSRRRSQSSEAELQKAISLDPKNVMAHLVLSGLLQKKGDMQGARQQASTAVDLDPKNLRSRVALVGLELHAGDKAAAEATLLQGTELLSDTPQGADLLWDYYARTGQVDQAASAYASLVAKHPKSVPLKVTYAHILIQQKNFAQATSVSDELMKTNSSDPQVAVLNGMLLLHAGKANDAFLALQKAEKNSPDNLPLKLLARAGGPGQGRSE